MVAANVKTISNDCSEDRHQSTSVRNSKSNVSSNQNNDPLQQHLQQHNEAYNHHETSSSSSSLSISSSSSSSVSAYTFSSTDSPSPISIPSPQSYSSTANEYRINENLKPPYSYATLICMAMRANKNKMTLSSIYKWIKENFLYYRNANPSWQNSIRHNLSLNKCFIKIARNKDEPGKGGFWKLDPVYADGLIDGIFKKRRANINHSKSMTATTAKVTHKQNSSLKGPIKKRCRKKYPISLNDCENFLVDIVEPNNNHIEQETPPNSAESYRYTKLECIDELNNAIESIDGNLSYSCTFHQTNESDPMECGTDPLIQGFVNEICIDQINNECIEPEGHDLCWNTILTDVDLGELVDPISYTDPVASIIHPIENESNRNALHQSNNNFMEKRNATKLVSIDLESIIVDGQDPTQSTSALLEDQRLFYHTENQQVQINDLSFSNISQMSQVISATPNVVTCINESNLVDHWNQWNAYSSIDDTTQECSAQSAEMILSHMLESNHNDMGLNEIGICKTHRNRDPNRTMTFVKTLSCSRSSSSSTPSVSTDKPETIASTTTVLLNPLISTSDYQTNSLSQSQQQQQQQQHQQQTPVTESPTNFETNNAIRSWECKSSLDGTGIELENFNARPNANPDQQF
ncbi:hypothetical protein NH340_JMT00652 [Sarcoptes scabiei]|nr:hypothetical protein NH340_JMT00652 [Sarcoptes scabiei]